MALPGSTTSPWNARPNEVSALVFTAARASPGSSLVVRVLERFDLDLVHLEHRLHHAVDAFGVPVGQHLIEHARDDLPGHTEAVREPATRIRISTLRQRVPVMVDLLLRVAVHDERDRSRE